MSLKSRYYLLVYASSLWCFMAGFNLFELPNEELTRQNQIYQSNLKNYVLNNCIFLSVFVLLMLQLS